MSHSWKLHNAMWPGLVGKEAGSDQPPIGLDRMLELTVNSRAQGRGFDGVDLFLYEPHLQIDASDDAIHRLADDVAGRGLAIGSVVAPVWGEAMGGSAMGDPDARARFLAAVECACRWARLLREHGVRSTGIVRIDSADTPANWAADPDTATAAIAATFRDAGRIAEDAGERLAAEGEVCWAAMHSLPAMLDLLEAVGMPGVVGFQADLAHTYHYLIGTNAPPEHALLAHGYSEEDFWAAYKLMTDQLRPWTLDFHIAQTDGTVHGSGSHDKTGRHCPADAPDGLLDVPRCAAYWLLDPDGSPRQEIEHMCWDGCMFDNALLEDQATWDTILDLMIQTLDHLGLTSTPG
jgi:sugar phosphate isomerase/epimerase